MNSPDVQVGQNTLARPTLLGHLQIARVDHWFKNVFVLPGIVVAVSLDPGSVVPHLWLRIVLGLLAVCLVASSNYVINELMDARFDRFHPVKCNRPVPSDKVVRQLDVGFLPGTFSKISPSSIPAAVNHRAALVKAQRQSFADFYIPTQKSCRYDEEAVCSGRNRNMRFILGDSPAINRTHLRRRALRDRHFSNGGSRCTHVCFGHFRYLITAS